MYSKFMVFKATLTGICVLAYGIQTYMGQLVPAYQALIWCFVVLLVDIAAILEDR